MHNIEALSYLQSANDGDTTIEKHAEARLHSTRTAFSTTTTTKSLIDFQETNQTRRIGRYGIELNTATCSTRRLHLPIRADSIATDAYIWTLQLSPRATTTLPTEPIPAARGRTTRRNPIRSTTRYTRIRAWEAQLTPVTMLPLLFRRWRWHSIESGRELRTRS